MQKCKERLERKNERERDIAVSLKKYNNEVHPRGEMLPEQQQVYHVKVVSAFLKAGLPLSKVDKFRDCFEKNALRLTDRRGMHDIIPFIFRIEGRFEVDGRLVAVIFDGTSCVGEALAVLLRFIDQEWCIQQHLVRVQMLSKSLSGEELARELITVLSMIYSVRSNTLLAAMKDGASVNNCAIRTLQVVNPLLIDVKSFSHMIDHVGGCFQTPTLSEFITLWVCLFSHSPKTVLLWKSKTDRSMSSYSSTRWRSKWEVIKCTLLMLSLSCRKMRWSLGPHLCSKLLTFFDNPQITSKLEVEIAARVNWGEHS